MRRVTDSDIAEMRARGYDPYTIREAEADRDQTLAADLLCGRIRTAFAGITLGDGTGLRQAQGLDEYADAETCAAFRAQDEKEDWQKIPTERLNSCYDSLAFMDPEGLRFHLPAFMVAVLSGEYRYEDSHVLTHVVTFCGYTQYGLRTSPELEAMRDFLGLFRSDPGCASAEQYIQRELDAYRTESTSDEP